MRSGQSTHQRIFEEVRTQILSGKIKPGSYLPPIRELAKTWQASLFTINTALKALAKEGWLELRHGARTYVTDPRSRFLCAGIYHDSNIMRVSHPLFGRNLHFALIRQLERIQKDSLVFSDFRPEKEQHTIMPSLAAALHQRRIQCLIVPSTNKVNSPWLGRLSMPVAFTGHPSTPKRVTFDLQGMFQDSARHLANEGCRSAGVISSINRSNPRAPSDSLDSCFYSWFRTAMAKEKITTAEPWIRALAGSVPEVDLEKYGYEEFKRLWKLSKKPDALIVYPDTVAIGVILAMAEIGFQKVAKQMKFILHRNVNSRIFCPLPVTWALSDEDDYAEALIQQLQKQFAGEKISPTLVPLRLTM